jgi:hypothetical protein
VLTICDLNTVVSHMEDVLRRLIDEHIELAGRPRGAAAARRSAGEPDRRRCGRAACWWSHSDRRHQCRRR